MSQEKVALIRKAFEGGRWPAGTAETYWHPELEYVEDPRWPGASRYKGRAAVLRCFENYLEALGPVEDWVLTVERVLDAGPRQVAFLRMQSPASTSGLPWERLWGRVVEIREERIIYLRAYYEPGEALEPVGLPKQAGTQGQ